MKRIFKYPLAGADVQVLRMHKGAQPLCVQMQNDVPHLWALVDDQQPPAPVQVWTVGTGHPLHSAERLVYVGTYQLHGGALVFHVFWEYV